MTVFNFSHYACVETGYALYGRPKGYATWKMTSHPEGDSPKYFGDGFLKKAIYQLGFTNNVVNLITWNKL